IKPSVKVNTCWSAPGNTYRDEVGFESDDDDDLDLSRPSPFNCCCADLSDYDEQARKSILDFSGTGRFRIPGKQCPRVISEANSLSMYDATPSPHRSFLCLLCSCCCPC
ncbi:unnamed protein product, partial [Gongylonema pulchrum]|uniref:Phospholipid scramblase n=1 Tax=Gongylonema pulchrum TaxID=637853 RepID=A0A183CU67_9BILA